MLNTTICQLDSWRVLYSRWSDASDSSHAPRTPPPSKNDLPNGSIDTLRRQSDQTLSSITKPGSTVATRLKHDTADTITLGLQEAIVDARERGAQQLKLDLAFVEVILTTLESRKIQFNELKNRFDGIKVGHHIALLSVLAYPLSPANKQTVHTRSHSCADRI
jgi:hypothetical protein